MQIIASRRMAVILLSAMLLFPVATKGRSPQQEDERAAVKTADGFLIIWNRPDLSFTISIKGKEVKPLDAGEHIFFTVDGKVLQIQSLPISNFAPDARKDKLSDDAILNAHRDWERAFIESELLHQPISVKSSAEKLPNGMQAMIWQYDLPKDVANSDARTQMYVTVVAKDYLILMNGVVNSDFSEAQVRSFLAATMSTLKISSERIDVNKEQEKARKGQP
jgi:hypothetical protein